MCLSYIETCYLRELWQDGYHRKAHIEYSVMRYRGIVLQREMEGQFTREMIECSRSQSSPGAFAEPFDVNALKGRHVEAFTIVELTC